MASRTCASSHSLRRFGHWRFKLALPVYIDQMLVSGLDRDLEQLGDEPLRQPDSAAIEADLEAGGAVPIDQDLAGRRRGGRG